MAANYGQLNAIKDAATRQLLQALFDQNTALQQQIAALQGNALQRGSPVVVDAILQHVLNPVAPTDAVNLQTLKKVVQFALARPPGTPPGVYTQVPGVPGDPNVVPGDALPLPAELATIQAVFAANPGFVATSCQDAPGGTWDLMNAIVAALRAIDGRWGYNGSRGNTNDPSGDAVAYDFDPGGPGGHGSTTVYIVDVIAGHCGPSPSAAFQDVTVFAPGVWLSGPY